MKKQRTTLPRSTASRNPSGMTRLAKSSLPIRMLRGFEPLEAKRVLAANILASGESAIPPSGAEQEATITVSMPDASAGSESTLKFSVRAIDGSSLDPAAVTIVDANGNPVAGQLQTNNLNGSTASETVASLPAGEFGVRVNGESGDGSYVLEVSLVGDVEADDAAVDAFETLRASAAVVQTTGTGNFVTQLYFESFGIDLSVDQSDPGMDANSDGIINGDDLRVIEANSSMGTVNVALTIDSDGPAFSNLRLTDDTGVSSTDRITTNPSTLVDITDRSQITSLTASLNGGAAVDITPLVGDFNTSGSFLLDTSDYNSIAGGTLAAGATTIVFNATDALGNTSQSETFDFTYIPNNSAPNAASVSPLSATEDAAFTANMANFIVDSDPGDILQFNATGLPGWLSINADGVLSGTPTNADVGQANFTVIATDSQGLSATAPVTVTVANTNDPPVLDSTIPDQTAFENQPFSFDFSGFFSDPDVGDTLTFSAILAQGFDSNGNVINGGQLPSWLSADENSGVLSGTPDDADVGSLSIGIIAVDSIGETANGIFTLTINGQNDPPTLDSVIPDQAATEDQSFSLNLTPFFSDPDGDTLTFSSTNLPGWLSITGTTLSGTPSDGDEGTSTITITATDVGNLTASGSFDITVTGVNDTPVIENQSFLVNPLASNGTVVGTVQATDDDVNDTLTFSLTSGNTNGAFALGPGGLLTVADNTQLADGTTVNLTVEVTDGVETASATVSVVVASNQAPIANNDNGFSTPDNEVLTIDVADLLANDLDPDNDTLTIDSVSSSSAQGASISLVGDSIRFDGRLADALNSLRDGDSLTDTFTYTISDGNGGTDTATVSVDVQGIDVVRYRLEVQDGNGNAVTSVQTGETFELVAFVEDIRTDAVGVFSAYLDVDYTTGLANASGIEHSTTYPNATSGSFATDGVLDEVGGVDGLSPLGGDEIEVFRASFTAGDSAGVITFTSNETEDQTQRATLIFGDSVNLPPAQVIFESTTLTISAGNSSSLSGGASFGHNADNPYDVNADGFVSPLDALLVINALETGEVAADALPDVNADGSLAPLDALLVINELSAEQQSVVSNQGDAPGILTGNDSDTSAGQLQSGLDSLFAELAADLSSGRTSLEDLEDELAPNLVDAIADVLAADPASQDDLWAALAEDWASFIA